MSEQEGEVWHSPRGEIRIWMPRTDLVLSVASGHFDVELAKMFLGYLEQRVAHGEILTGLHDWSAIENYDPDTRKVLTRWTDVHRSSFERIVIYTQSRIMRMGIATAKIVLGSVVEAVGTRAALDKLIAEAMVKPVS
jgi:hypothetical protein